MKFQHLYSLFVFIISQKSFSQEIKETKECINWNKNHIIWYYIENKDHSVDSNLLIKFEQFSQITLSNCTRLIEKEFLYRLILVPTRWSLLDSLDFDPYSFIDSLHVVEIKKVVIWNLKGISLNSRQVNFEKYKHSNTDVLRNVFRILY